MPTFKFWQPKGEENLLRSLSAWDSVSLSSGGITPPRVYEWLPLDPNLSSATSLTVTWGWFLEAASVLLWVSHGSAVPVFVSLLFLQLSPSICPQTYLTLQVPAREKVKSPSSVPSARPLTLPPLFFPDRPGSQLLFLTHLPCAQRIWLHCQNVTMTKTTLKRVRHQQYLQNLRLPRRQVGAVCTVAKTSKNNLEFHKRSLNRERRTPFHTGPVSTHPGLKGGGRP